MRIFSSPENFRRVLLRMSSMIFSADSPAPLAIGSLLVRWQEYLSSQRLRRLKSL